MIHEAEVVSVPALGRADIRIPRLYGDSVVPDVRSAVDVSPGDRVIVADLAGKAHVHAWHIVSFVSEIGRFGAPYPHTHPQGQVDGLVARLEAIEARLAAGGL